MLIESTSITRWVVFTLLENIFKEGTLRIGIFCSDDYYTLMLLLFFLWKFDVGDDSKISFNSCHLERLVIITWLYSFIGFSPRCFFETCGSVPRTLTLWKPFHRVSCCNRLLPHHCVHSEQISNNQHNDVHPIYKEQKRSNRRVFSKEWPSKI